MRDPAMRTSSTPAPKISQDEDIYVLVIDPSPLGRSCTLAVLDTAAGLRARGAADIASTPDGEMPDMILFQGSYPDERKEDRSAQLAQATRRWPNAAMIVIAHHDDADQILDSLRQGVRAFLTSDIGLDLLVDAIHVVHCNLAVYPSHILQIVRDALDKNGTADGSHKRQLDHRRFQDLTPRQQDVLRLLAIGQSNKLIAKQLQISESTVKVHIRAIMEQAGAHNRTQVIAHFLGQEALLARMEMPS